MLIQLTIHTLFSCKKIFQIISSNIQKPLKYSTSLFTLFYSTPAKLLPLSPPAAVPRPAAPRFLD